MKIRLVTPAPSRSRSGNRVTALRWSRLLRELGHKVVIEQVYNGQACDLAVALHARRSHESIARLVSDRGHAGSPALIVALTGTDLYDDIHHDARAKQSLEWADRLVVLQPRAVEALPAALRGKVRVIHQSVRPLPRSPALREGVFDVCVLGHLREVKDPFRTAEAARRLPATSRVRVLHAGAALTEEMARQAESQAASNPRYRWLGDLPHWRAMRLLARCRLLVVTSKMEGGANVVSEAVTHGVPVISSRIDGSIGLLGEDYPGYFPVGDTAALTGLLTRAETDEAFYATLKAACQACRPLFTPDRESQTWRLLLAEFPAR